MSKKPKVTDKLSKKSRNKCCFLMVCSVKSALILLPFLTITQHESGIKISISFVSDRNVAKIYPVGEI